MRYGLALFAAVLCIPGPLFAQEPPPPAAVTRDALPPTAILQDELATFDSVRSDMANWSDIELAAFAATTAAASADCLRIEQTPHEGDEELALAKLCALGRNWDGAYSAARWYTRRSAPAEQATHLPTAFALLLQADLNLQAVDRAVTELAEMQERLPLTAETDGIFSYAIEAMEVNRPEYGLRAAQLRQPALLAAVSGGNETVSVGLAEAQAWHTLALLHVAGRSAEEAADKSQLMQAIAARTAPPTVLDRYLAQQGRTRYEWLGRTLPPISVERSTYPPTGRQKLSVPKATLLLVETQTAVDTATLSLAMDSLRARLAPGTEAKLVLIGAENAKTDPHSPVLHAQFTHMPLLDTLGYTSGPLLLTLDAAGRVTWLSAASPAWLNPQQQAEELLERTLTPPSK